LNEYKRRAAECAVEFVESGMVVGLGHVGRALLAEGFREIATSMLFTKELAERVEERAFAPAVVR